MVNKRVWNAVLGCNLKNDRIISVHFQGKPFSITVIQAYAPTSNAEEAEVERFYEDLQDLLELTPKKDVLFIIEDWNAKVGSQETPGVTGKFGLGVWNEAGQRLIESGLDSRFNAKPLKGFQPSEWQDLIFWILIHDYKIHGCLENELEDGESKGKKTS